MLYATAIIIAVALTAVLAILAGALAVRPETAADSNNRRAGIAVTAVVAAALVVALWVNVSVLKGAPPHVTRDP